MYLLKYSFLKKKTICHSQSCFYTLKIQNNKKCYLLIQKVFDRIITVKEIKITKVKDVGTGDDNSKSIELDVDKVDRLLNFMVEHKDGLKVNKFRINKKIAEQMKKFHDYTNLEGGN